MVDGGEDVIDVHGGLGWIGENWRLRWDSKVEVEVEGDRDAKIAEGGDGGGSRAYLNYRNYINLYFK